MRNLFIRVIFIVYGLNEICLPSKSHSTKNRKLDVKELRLLNGTELILSCPPAELLIRTHMAPDFESPQLVRRLDWFQDSALVASYQQDVVSDINQQWWVAGTRYELRKPFYELRISPLLPQDSAVYKCRLDTDPLFAMDTNSASFALIVLVKPLPPSKPQITAYTDKSVTLAWTQSAGAAHRPILRYSILVSQVDDNNLRVLTTEGNKTIAVVPDLLPNTQYVFSVRAENSAGESGFGPETIFKTIGQAPTIGPKIVSVRNGTSGCIDVEWALPTESTDQNIVGYRIMVHRVGTGAMREWYVKGHKQSLCSLDFFTDYMLTIEADNGFGYSPSATSHFRTDQAAPDGPPESITVRALSSDTVSISWREPATPNGAIISYQIYYKEHKSQRQHPTLVRLLVEPGELSKTFAYNVTKLEPMTAYKFRMSASTAKGEGEKSPPIQVVTDRQVPQPPQLTNISFGCVAGHAVQIEWSPPPLTKAEQEYGAKLASDVPYIYRLVVESIQTKERLVLNSTLNRIAVDNLKPNVRYGIFVYASLASLFNNQTNFESAPSKKEVFLIRKERCQLYSSICSPTNTNCQTISLPAMENQPSSHMGGHSATSISFLLLLFGVAITVAVSMFFAWFLKRRCILFKEFLRRAEKRKDFKDSNHQNQLQEHETISLVPESLDLAFGQTITVLDFSAYCQKLTENNNEGYRLQFQEIEMDNRQDIIESPTLENGSIDENNRLKNRYMNIGAVEHTRIHIHSGISSDGYINANFIDSCDSHNAYIATQAPLPHTFSDFWTMIWQENCNVIVAITNLVEGGRVKCDQYWPPTLRATMAFDNFQLTLDSEQQNSVFVHRIITLRALNCPPGTSERTIHQVHFTSWPDHAVPQTVFPLLYFLNYVSEIEQTGPIVVHCSAGVGRSGSFILIDSMRRHLLQCDRINIQAHLRHIRRQRSHLVQTLDQYIFCHDVLSQLIRHGITRQSVLNFSSYLEYLLDRTQLAIGDERSRLQVQYEELCKCLHQPNCERSVGCITLPGYHRADEFLVCNWTADCPALWATLWEHRCRAILLLGSDAEVGDYFRPSTDSLTLLVKSERASAPLIRIAVNGAQQCQRNYTSNCPSPPALSQSLLEERVIVSIPAKDRLVLKCETKELTVKVIRVRPSILELNTWAEIERIQEELLPLGGGHDCSQQLILLDPRGGPTSSLPFILCALQSTACQLEQERHIDICLFLTWYKHLACGCWSTQSNIEYIYAKVLELIQLQRCLP
ncbi:protein-tyrosine phosphatase domain-containing protein [Ditylenchus destructor]|nr:protein-tyrosine phosphatase domain-containing protein [Ditylenchus destructor]